MLRLPSDEVAVSRLFELRLGEHPIPTVCIPTIKPQAKLDVGVGDREVLTFGSGFLMDPLNRPVMRTIGG